MARYRSKDTTDLRWNDIRRRITKQLDAEVAAVREYYLDKLLTAAWEEFAKSLETGQVMSIESEVADWVRDAMDKAVAPKMAELDVANMSRAPQN